MQTIWKFPLEVTDQQILQVPAGYTILDVGTQDDDLVLWVRVDPTARLVPLHIAVRGTGNPIGDDEPDEYHLGTVQVGSFAWHIFEQFPDE